MEKGEIVIERLTGRHVMLLEEVDNEWICRFGDGRQENRRVFELAPSVLARVVELIAQIAGELSIAFGGSKNGWRCRRRVSCRSCAGSAAAELVDPRTTGGPFSRRRSPTRGAGGVMVPACAVTAPPTRVRGAVRARSRWGPGNARRRRSRRRDRP